MRADALAVNRCVQFLGPVRSSSVIAVERLRPRVAVIVRGFVTHHRHGPCLRAAHGVTGAQRFVQFEKRILNDLLREWPLSRQWRSITQQVRVPRFEQLIHQRCSVLLLHTPLLANLPWGGGFATSISVFGEFLYFVAKGAGQNRQAD